MSQPRTSTPEVSSPRPGKAVTHAGTARMIQLCPVDWWNPMELDLRPHESVFTWAAPPLKFGEGAVDEIASDVAGFGISKALIITDAGVRQGGVPDRVAEQLRSAGVTCEIFDQVAVEPTDVSITQAVEYARQGDWDGFGAIGGGSELDTAKAGHRQTH